LFKREGIWGCLGLNRLGSRHWLFGLDVASLKVSNFMRKGNMVVKKLLKFPGFRDMVTQKCTEPSPLLAVSKEDVKAAKRFFPPKGQILQT
jgi:hypothetical protein